MTDALKTSIATVSVSGLLDGKLEAIARAGFDAVEIFENDLLSSQLSAAQVGTLMRDLGLECAMLQPFRDCEGMPAADRARFGADAAQIRSDGRSGHRSHPAVFELFAGIVG